MTEDDTFDALRKYSFEDADVVWDKLRFAMPAPSTSVFKDSKFLEEFKRITAWDAHEWFREWERRRDPEYFPAADGR